MTKDFNPAEALDLLDEIDRLMTSYGAMTGRSAVSDWDMRYRLEEHADDGTLRAGIDVDNAMVALYATGATPSIWGNGHMADANFEGFSDEVTEALDLAGIYVPEPDVPGIEWRNAGSTLSGIEVMAVRDVEGDISPASADDATAWGIYTTYSSAPTMHVEDYETREEAEHVAAALGRHWSVPATTLPAGEVAA